MIKIDQNLRRDQNQKTDRDPKKNPNPKADPGQNADLGLEIDPDLKKNNHVGRPAQDLAHVTGDIVQNHVTDVDGDPGLIRDLGTITVTVTSTGENRVALSTGSGETELFITTVNETGDPLRLDLEIGHAVGASRITLQGTGSVIDVEN